jgi:hypothetical protein
VFEAKHAITHHRIVMTVLAGQLGSPVRALATERMGWFAWDELEGLGLTGLARKVVAHLAP